MAKTVSLDTFCTHETSSNAHNFIGAGAEDAKNQTNDNNDVFNTIVESVIKEDYISLMKLFRLQKHEIEVYSTDNNLEDVPEHRKMSELAVLAQKKWLKIYKQDFLPNLETARKFALENEIPFNFDDLIANWFEDVDIQTEASLSYTMHHFEMFVHNYTYEHSHKREVSSAKKEMDILAKIFSYWIV